MSIDILHPQASWKLEYNEQRAGLPQRLYINGKPVASFMHNAIDGFSDEQALPTAMHHYRRGGCALYECEAAFANGAAIGLTTRTAANCQRQTADVAWPQRTTLQKSLELGNAVLLGEWKRYFAVMPGDDLNLPPVWKPLPQSAEDAPVVLEALPAAIILENADGQRVEFGLGDDLWRWAKALNGDYLQAKPSLRITRTASHLELRRAVALVDMAAEKAAADERNRRLQLAFEKAQAAAAAQDALRGEVDAGEEDDEEAAPATPPASPVAQPEGRIYRFNSYLAWSAPELQADAQTVANAAPVAFDHNGALPHQALTALGEEPALAIDLSKLPIAPNARRTDHLPCWENRRPQALFRRIIRQLANYSKRGILRIDGGFAPGWCEVGRHVNRHGEAQHWDLSAIIDAAVWARQILGDGWCIAVPQRGIAAEMPSLQALFAPSGFRGDAVEPAENAEEEGAGDKA